MNGQRRFAERYPASLTLAAVGGYLEAYTYVTRDGVFANAQTGNIARIGIQVAKGDFEAALRYGIPVLAFVIGVTLAAQLKRWAEHKEKAWERLILPMEILLLFAAGLIPENGHAGMATLLIAFVCAIQAESFRKFSDHPFASTMCTGNLRSGTEKWNSFLHTGDRKELRAALQYYGIDVVFLAGAAGGYWLTAAFRCRAVWISCGILTLLWICSIGQDRGKAAGLSGE